jgi:magnesium chelatase subunit D
MTVEAMTPQALALCAFLAQPTRYDALVIRSARPGPVRQVVHQLLQSLSRQSGRPLARLPASASAETLRPALDVVQTLANRAPVYDAGWIARHRNCTVLINMAERIEPGLAHELAQALDHHQFQLMLFDESLEGEAGLLPILFDRMSIVIEQDQLVPAGQDLGDWLSSMEQGVLRARRPVRADHDLTTDQWRRLAALASALAVSSARPLVAASRLALDCNRLLRPRMRHVSDEVLDSSLVASLLPHARQWPEHPSHESTQPQPEAPPIENQSDEQPSSEQAPEQTASPDHPPSQGTAPEDQQAVEAALVDLQDGLLTSGARDHRRLIRSGQARREGGRAGQKTWHANRGRRLRVTTWKRGQSVRQLAWVKILERALPLQDLRRQSGPRDGHLLLVPSDLRVWKRQHRRPLTTIFLVDASGSMAATRLAEAKGAVQALLAECYVRRDQVALLSFGGQGVRVNLPPTRSLVAAKRALTALPGGGASPVAAGLQAVIRLVDRLTQQGEDVAIVVLSDGRANVCLDGRVDRPLAGQEAQQVARLLATQAIKSIWIDASPRSEPAAQTLAAAMSASYVPLPFASAGQIHGLVSSAMKSTTGVTSVS